MLLGKFELTFAKALDGKVILDDEKPVEEAGTIMRSVGDISKLLELEAAKQKKGGPAEVKQIEKANRILKVLTKVAETLIASRPMEEVLHQVMEIVFDHIPADRGFLMLRGADGELEPHVIKHRKSQDDSEGKITISRTIAKKVIADRVAILTSDAQVDSRFQAGDSIRIQGIRSAMCAPMWNQDRVIGIIFVDSLMLTNNFGEDDLDLLAALANYAAVAVEHTRLNEKIAAEEKKRDRLGRFLSPQVASRILAASDSQDDSLGVPELREVTVLFSDICGFTSMSEKMSPSAVSLLLSDYLSRMTDAASSRKGLSTSTSGTRSWRSSARPSTCPTTRRGRFARRSRCASGSMSSTRNAAKAPSSRCASGSTAGKSSPARSAASTRRSTRSWATR